MTSRVFHPWHVLRARRPRWSVCAVRHSSGLVHDVHKQRSNDRSRGGVGQLQSIRRTSAQAPGSHDGRLRAFGSVITTDNPDVTTISQILQNIQDLTPPSLPTTRWGLVVLVTPSFSKHALSAEFSKEVIRALLGRRHMDNPVGRTFHVITAVVDRLPRPVYQYSESPDNTMSRRDTQAVSAEGHEGLAYAIVDNVLATPAPEMSSAGRHGGVGKSDDLRVLSLTIRASKATAVDTAEEQRDTSGVMDADGDMTFQIPLANTLFETGQPQTMAHFGWRIEADGADLTLVSMENLMLAEALVDIGSALGVTKSVAHVDIAANIVPLTLPQRVHAAMGNVIREVSGPDDLHDIVPASQQLEKSVASYFRALNMPQRAVEVWALITPEALSNLLHNGSPHQSDAGARAAKAADLVKLWASPGSAWQDRVLAAVTAGGRLVKVLSGGGGWGKRAGLLSLDHETSFIAPKEEDSEADSFEGPAFLSSAGAAKPGELVQFFIATDRPAQKTTADWTPGYELPTLEFGTTPPASDTPGAEVGRRTGIPAELHTTQGYFGALAEKGIAFQTASRQAQASWTKLDVPNSRIIVTLIPEPMHSPETRSTAPVAEQGDARRSRRSSAKPRAGSDRSSVSGPKNATARTASVHKKPLSITRCPVDHQVKLKEFLRQTAQHLRALNAASAADTVEQLLNTADVRMPKRWRWVYKLDEPRTRPQALATSLATGVSRLSPSIQPTATSGRAVVSGRMARPGGDGSRKAAVANAHRPAMITNAHAGHTGYSRPGRSMLREDAPSSREVNPRSGRVVVRRCFVPPRDMIRKFYAHGHDSTSMVRNVLSTPALEKKRYTDPMLANLADAVTELLKD